jgi:protein-tyrosine phosphatase
LSDAIEPFGVREALPTGRGDDSSGGPRAVNEPEPRRAEAACYTGGMRGFVDLHCHWIANIDDGARSPEDGLTMLRGLFEAGFSTVVATPHMRPGMFDNDRPALERAYAAMQPYLTAATTRGDRLPAVRLASEHFFDDVVWARLTRGEALPYSGESGEVTKSGLRFALLELPVQAFPVRLVERFVDLKRAGIRVVLAHPERYRPVWANDACRDPLIDAGARLLLDVCALVGKYGRASKAAAEKLLEEDAYDAACSDAHRPDDIPLVRKAIAGLEARMGREETERLLAEAPSAILRGE